MAKFLLPADLAFGAFDHFIYRPFKPGGSRSPLSHTLAVTQAAPAALLVYHDLILAASDVKSSPRLQRLSTRLATAANTILALRSKFLLGTSKPADITAANASLARVKSASSAAGALTVDKVVPGEQPTGVVTTAR